MLSAAEFEFLADGYWGLGTLRKIGTTPFLGCPWSAGPMNSMPVARADEQESVRSKSYLHAKQ
jgi:hypothetical protein